MIEDCQENPSQNRSQSRSKGVSIDQFMIILHHIIIILCKGYACNLVAYRWLPYYILLLS